MHLKYAIQIWLIKIASHLSSCLGCCWGWKDLLASALGVTMNGEGYTFMSDRQKLSSHSIVSFTLQALIFFVYWCFLVSYCRDCYKPFRMLYQRLMLDILGGTFGVTLTRSGMTLLTRNYFRRMPKLQQRYASNWKSEVLFINDLVFRSSIYARASKFSFKILLLVSYLAISYFFNYWLKFT